MILVHFKVTLRLNSRGLS